MVEFLACHLLGELLVLIGADVITSNTVPVIIECSLPTSNLTIEDLKISPIDDHITFGIQV